MRGPVSSRWSRGSAALAVVALAAIVLATLSALTARPRSASAATQIQVYGTWLCGTDECTWASAPNMTTFDDDNHWLIDRGNGTPSVNLVVLAFVNPLKLLDQTTDSGDVNGVPAGMTSAVVNYFTRAVRRHRLESGSPAYHRPSRGGSIPHRARPLRHAELADDKQSGARLRQCHGGEQATRHQQAGRTMAGARQRRAAVQPAGSAARACQVHRERVHSGDIADPPGMQ